MARAGSLRALSRVTVVAAVLVAVVALSAPAGAQTVDTPEIPSVEEPVEAPGGAASPTPPAEPAGVSLEIVTENVGTSQAVMLVLLLTIGSIAPAILLMMTSFTRFIIVLGLARQAIGAPTVPPTQVLVGLALFLTAFVMGDVFARINDEALQPLLAGEMEQGDALVAAYAPLEEFMLAQTDADVLSTMMAASGSEPLAEGETPSWTVTVPSYVLSELKTAFTIAFVIFVPFLVLDLVIASILMSLGMVMLPPVFISLPVKLLLFVLIDGWGLIVGSLVESVQVPI